MFLTEKLKGFKDTKGYKNFKGTTMLKLFGLTKVPLIFVVNPKVRELTDSRCSVEIPLSRMTKNHWGSMYFGALAIGADCSAGLFAMYKAEKIKTHNISIVFKDFKANFIKRPESSVCFVCTDSNKIDQMLKKAIETNERVTEGIRIEARVPANSDELVAEFELGLSLKAK